MYSVVALFTRFRNRREGMSNSSKFKVVRASNLNSGTRLSTGCFAIDQAIGGGLPDKGIVEITGESSCGKSSFCMQLTLTVQYPVDQGGWNGAAVYICTEERFQSRRLQQLIENFPKHYYNDKGGEMNFGERILVTHAGDFKDLLRRLSRITTFTRKRNIKLIIIDSITAIFRGEYKTSEGRKRVEDIRRMGKLLTKISLFHNLLFVCVNQVAQSLKTGKTVPALGLSWANLITSRLALIRSGDARYFKVAFSPQMPSQLCVPYSIQLHGITDLEQ